MFDRPATAPCPFQVGARLHVTPQVILEVQKVKRVRGCWRISGIVHDHRPRLLHRNSSHGYTHVAAQAVPGEPEAVPAHYQATLSSDADPKNAVAQARQRAEAEHDRLAMKLHAASVQGKVGRARNLQTRLHRIGRVLEMAA